MGGTERWCAPDCRAQQRSLEVTVSSVCVCRKSLSVTLAAALGVGEEKHCWAMVKAVRSWGQSSASLWVEHSLGPGWILRGEKSSTVQQPRGNSCLTNGKVFQLTASVLCSCSSRSCADWQLRAKCCAVGQAKEELCSESLRHCVGTGCSLRTKVNKLHFCNQRW